MFPNQYLTTVYCNCDHSLTIRQKCKTLSEITAKNITVKNIKNKERLNSQRLLFCNNSPTLYTYYILREKEAKSLPPGTYPWLKTIKIVAAYSAPPDLQAEFLGKGKGNLGK